MEAKHDTVYAVTWEIIASSLTYSNMNEKKKFSRNIYFYFYLFLSEFLFRLLKIEEVFLN